MKKILIFLSLLIFCNTIFASSINHIVFFGDSLSDNGNLYKFFFKIIPKSPPYFQGRFSNGPTWAENVGQFFYNKAYMDYQIYAVGGATAILHLPKLQFIAPTTLDFELMQYSVDSLLMNKSHTLFVIWIGANDYLYEQDSDKNVLTQKVVDQVGYAINSLIGLGAKNFLILNLPDLSVIPFARQNGSIEKLHELSVLHNIKLDKIVSNLQVQHPEINFDFISVFDIFNDFLANPDKYNKKYNVHITNTVDACWAGGFVWKNDLGAALSTEFQQALRQNNPKSMKEIDPQLVNQFLLGSPAIQETYQVGKFYKELIPCDNANEYIFWDKIHPTQVVHKVLSDIVLEKLNAKYFQ